jgi:hypothetical protein
VGWDVAPTARGSAPLERSRLQSVGGAHPGQPAAPAPDAGAPTDLPRMRGKFRISRGPSLRSCRSACARTAVAAVDGVGASLCGAARPALARRRGDGCGVSRPAAEMLRSRGTRPPPRARRRMATAALAAVAAALVAADPAAALADVTRRARTNFTLVAQTDYASNPDLVPGRRCAQSISHLAIGTFTNINQTAPEAKTDALRFSDLLVNGDVCNASTTAQSATVFEGVAQSANGTPVEVAEMFFLRGTDNSPRRCRAYDADNPAFYYFTDNLPLFRERMEEENLLPRGSAALRAANKSRVYMLSRQFSRSDGSVVDDVVCTFQAAATPQPRGGKDGKTADRSDKGKDGGSACFPATATVRVAVAGGGGGPHRNDAAAPAGSTRFVAKRVDALQIGEAVSVGGGREAPVSVSEVFFFSHRDATTEAPFVVIDTEAVSSEAALFARGGERCGASAAGGLDRLCAADVVASSTSITLSPDHYIWTRPRGLLRASEVRPLADGLVREDGSAAQVVAVKRTVARGLYAPHTLTGTLCVDGFLVSAYTAAVPPAVAHAILAPLRFMYVSLGLAVEAVMDRGFSPRSLARPVLVRPTVVGSHSQCRRAGWGLVGRAVELVLCPFLLPPSESQ